MELCLCGGPLGPRLGEEWRESEVHPAVSSPATSCLAKVLGVLGTTGGWGSRGPAQEDQRTESGPGRKEGPAEREGSGAQSGPPPPATWLSPEVWVVGGSTLTSEALGRGPRSVDGEDPFSGPCLWLVWTAPGPPSAQAWFNGAGGDSPCSRRTDSS